MGVFSEIKISISIVYVGQENNFYSNAVRENFFYILEDQRIHKFGQTWFNWYIEAQASKISVNGPIMKEKYLYIPKSPRIKFQAPSEWLDLFKFRYGINVNSFPVNGNNARQRCRASENERSSTNYQNIY